VRVEGFDPRGAGETLNRWIAHETARAAREATAALETYRFNEAAENIYRFVWNVFCDWYVELAKPYLTGPDGSAKTETRAMTAWALDEILKLLHPFMPFVTEELWRVTGEAGPRREGLLVLAQWPRHTGLDDTDAEEEIGWVIELISAVRSVRTEMNVPAGTPIPLALVTDDTEIAARAKPWEDFIKRLARLSAIDFPDAVPPQSVQMVVRGDMVALPLAGIIDIGAERARLEREMAKAASEIARIDAKLANRDFIARAPEEVVEGEREKREEAEDRRAKIKKALERLEGAL
jgi:valyl-tRNA synthetase